MFWYVLKSKPHKEKVLYRELKAREIECYYPRLRVNPVNPRAAKVRPYFPGYMFVYLDLEEVASSLFQWMPFSNGLLSFGGEPAMVPEALVAGLKKRVGEVHSNSGQQFDQFEPGMRLRVVAGPFQGYQAIFDSRVDQNERVRILLQMLSDHHMPVELHAGQIAAIK